VNICRRNYKATNIIILRINVNTIFLTIVIDIILFNPTRLQIYFSAIALDAHTFQKARLLHSPSKESLCGPSGIPFVTPKPTNFLNGCWALALNSFSASLRLKSVGEPAF
jgi:hypothetical protein